MAENKKSFILYSDLIKSIEHLTNEEKGILFNHLLEYVNDRNPVLTDRLILTAWKPIELQLKRDLVKFEQVKVKRSEAGKASAEARALKTIQQTLTNPTSVDFVQHNSTNPTDSVTVNVNDTVTVNVTDIKKETPKVVLFNFKNSLLDYGFEPLLVDRWLEVRKKQKAVNTDVAFDGFIREIEKCGKDKNEVMRLCIEKSWRGFDASWVLGKTEPPPQKRRGSSMFDEM